MRRPKRLLLSGMDNYYGREVVKGIHNYCRSHGRWEYHLTSEGSWGLKAAKTAIQEWKPDGIIASINDDVGKQLMKRSGLPVVNLSMAWAFPLPAVFVDNAAAGRMVAKYLMDIGFRNFAFSSRTPEIYAGKRHEGFVGELSKAGFGCDVFTDQFISPNHDDWPTNHRRMGPWLQSLKKPVALMAVHDPRGQELTSVCERLGLRVPEDVTIVSVGNGELYCQMCNPPLSSVDIDHARIGYEATRLLERLIRGAKPPSKPILIPPRRVVVRRSSDIIAVDDPDVAAVMRFIREHASQPMSVKDLLRHVSISRSSMERRFEKLFGHSPSDAIVRVHLERAKSLLAETDMSIRAIALDSGYKNQEIFATSFRREVGLTPTQYRRNCSKIIGISNGFLHSSVK